MNDEIQMVPIDRIRILNPRHRDPKKFAVIIQSIRNLGLKKPIQVSLRASDEGEGSGYDLVCGQGRVEAYRALGFTEIPAIVVEISKEDRLIRSLVENIARRIPAPRELLNEIQRLKERGHSNSEIGKKLDIDDSTLAGLLTLSKAGEERLLEATLCGKVPLSVAIDIARTDSAETQRELLHAYEKKQLNHLSIRVVKRLMDQRRYFGKQCGRGGGTPRKSRTSVESLVNAYRRESQKQKLIVRKAKICDAKLLFVVTAFNKLLSDDNFATLLRAEALSSLPKSLWIRMNGQRNDAA